MSGRKLGGDRGLLCMTIRNTEKLVIGDGIEIVFRKTQETRVQIAIIAPKSMKVGRSSERLNLTGDLVIAAERENADYAEIHERHLAIAREFAPEDAQ